MKEIPCFQINLKRGGENHQEWQRAQQYQKMCLYPMWIGSINNNAGNTILKSGAERQNVFLKDSGYWSVFTCVQFEDCDLKCSIKLIKDSVKCCCMVQSVGTVPSQLPSQLQHISPLCVHLRCQGHRTSDLILANVLPPLLTAINLKGIEMASRNILYNLPT